MDNTVETARPEVARQVARQLEDPVTIALAVLVDRIRRLPAEDRNYLFELVQELPNAESRDALDDIYSAMREILSQRVSEARPMPLEADDEPRPKLQKWIDFVSEKIRSARAEADLTQTELAERSGLPQSHISRIENGKLSPSRATLEKIAKGLDRPLSDFDPSA